MNNKIDITLLNRLKNYKLEINSISQEFCGKNGKILKRNRQAYESKLYKSQSYLKYCKTYNILLNRGLNWAILNKI